MSVLDLVREDLRDFAGYSSARKEASGGRILLNANESPWPSIGAAAGLNRYPEPQPQALLEILSGIYGVTVDRLLVGRGSDEAIDLLVRALCRAGRDKLLISSPTFGMYAVCARVQGAGIVDVPLRAEDHFSLDVAAVLAAVDPCTRLVIVCSPNNPTGSLVAVEQLRALAVGLQGRALLLVDEAYAEFADAPSAIALTAEFDHVAVVRTLSKAYALAAARIGSLIADPALIRVIRSLMAPYPLPTPSLIAALAGLQPNALALVRSRIGLLREERRRLATGLARCPGVRQVFPSDGNFLLVRFADAAATYRNALAAGMLLRQPSAGSGLGDCLRISIGTPEENDAVLALLSQPLEVA